MRLYLLLYLFAEVHCLPANLLYRTDLPEAKVLPKGDDLSSPEVRLRVPVLFFGTSFETLYVNNNGFMSFQTDIPLWINMEFPLEYPIIAPFYSNVDTTRAGSVIYYETDDPELLGRATENAHEFFLNYGDFQATSLFVVTWKDVGYFDQGDDKLNTYQVAIATDGVETFVEFLYPDGGIQWIQGTGDQSGFPDARAQVGIVSPEGKLHQLPGSGTEQVRNLARLTNTGVDGQFVYKVDKPEIEEPDAIFDKKPNHAAPESCAEAPTYCHINAMCTDYDRGFCCKCEPKYYGNGKYCIKKDVPLRVNGKVNGKINGERLENLDLQSYVVMADGRAYTAVSKIPPSIGYDIQSAQILGGLIGYLFAKPLREARNGYQITGGVFEHSASVDFTNTSQKLWVKSKFLGLDVFDQLRLELTLEGQIPTLPNDVRVNIDEYQEQYTRTEHGLIENAAQRSFWYEAPNGERITHHYKVQQSFKINECPFENISVPETWTLKVGKNFISYEAREQIIRFGLSNKIVPLGDFDPCEEGRRTCVENSACVVENDSYRCICKPGFQEIQLQNTIQCVDMNECQTGQHECDFNSQCFNTFGSYECRCNPGFEGNGRICENAKSCRNVTCTENAECVENNAVAYCQCLKGFTGNGQHCIPVTDHSCHIANNCSPFGYCAINPETNNYFCSCLPGYTGDGYQCEEVPNTTNTDEESLTTTEGPRPGERRPQTCLLGVCFCPTGYRIETGTKYCLREDKETDSESEKIGTTTDNPEVGCDVLNNCHRNATCTYSDDTHAYQCVCNDGFEGNGFSCEPEYVSCTKYDNCSPHATCTYDDALGRSKCICNSGYTGDGYTCSIIAICNSNHDCAETEDCMLTSSNRYECVCKEGFVRDSQHLCVQAQGSCGGGRCVENADCVYDEDYQTYFCACKSGYVGDGITICKEKVIGCDTLNNCGAHAYCKFNEEDLSYKCECNEGFFGDGFSCYAQRNCHIDPSMCDPHAVCLSDANRHFICQCNSGYVGNGTICKEISRHEGNFLLVNQGMATLRIPLDPTKTGIKKPVQVLAFQTAVGLDFDCLEGRFYWSDINGRAIRSALFNGSMKEDFISKAIGSPEGLAVDWVSRNIYWTDSTLDTIEVANLDSRRRRVLFDSGLVNPRGIAVHPQRGKIFWTDWDRVQPKIEWANADGTGREIFLHVESGSLPNSLTIDYDTEQLCYADAGTHKIECVSIDSKTRQTVAVNCTYPFGIATTDKHIYWSDWISKQIERVDKYNLKRLPPIPVLPISGKGSRLFGLVAVANACPPVTNVCQSSYRNPCPAEHICLPNGMGSRRCMCAYRSDMPEDKPGCVL
nr:unnamed protein product [Callosobruchus analis]